MAPDTTSGPRDEPGQGWGWLEPSTTATLPDSSSTPRSEPDGGDPEWAWLAAHHDRAEAPVPDPPDKRQRPRLLPLQGWIVLSVVGMAATGLIVWGTVSVNRQAPEVAIPTITAAPPASTTPASTACTGLSGTTITDSVDGEDAMTRAIAAFERAYYVQRSAEAALRLLAPEAGIAPQPLEAGIASIPFGTRHCVAITPLAPTLARVHLAELHPDGQRIDYVQLINVRIGADGALITNIQKQG